MAGNASQGDGRRVMLVIVSAFFLALAILAVAMRIWSVRLKKRSLSRSDYVILLALVCDPEILRIPLLTKVSCSYSQSLWL